MTTSPQDAARGRTVAALRRDAETRAAGLPALLAQAERLAMTIQMGAHGRRRSGPGETFWQYRRALPGDPATAVDWRRSARSDALFIRETEWESAQTVWLWSDRAHSMAYVSDPKHPPKRRRAAELALALSILLVRGGERVALVGSDAARPSIGEAQLRRIASALIDADESDYGVPPRFDARRGGRCVFVSDFFADETEIVDSIRAAASLGLTGLLLQVVDPAEEQFPFDGRLVFESMAGVLRYETERAGALRADYAAALERRRARLAETARAAGWRFQIHRSSESPAPALMWLALGLSQPMTGGAL